MVDVHGITLVVTSVEIWADVVISRLGGLPSDESDRRIAEAEAARRDWSPESGEEPPTPWDHFRGLEIGLRDDAGTRYRSRGGAVGGTGTEWRMEWRYAPAPPDGVETLLVTASAAGQPRFEVPIAL